MWYQTKDSECCKVQSKINRTNRGKSYKQMCKEHREEINKRSTYFTINADGSIARFISCWKEVRAYNKNNSIKKFNQFTCQN